MKKARKAFTDLRGTIDSREWSLSGHSQAVKIKGSTAVVGSVSRKATDDASRRVAAEIIVRAYLE